MEVAARTEDHGPAVLLDQMVDLVQHRFGEAPIRCDDVLEDPRYGQMAPHHGMPKGHLPVRSYLAVPVTSRTGEVQGGLFFGHPQPGIFDDRSERIVAAIAVQAAIAIDKAKLYRAAQDEIARRRRTEEALRQSEQSLESKVSVRTAELAAANARLIQELLFSTGSTPPDFTSL